jgi:DNA topoisomerase VI subunit A
VKQCYIEKNFRGDSLKQIYLIDSIVVEYQRQGYVLTVRQLYYQLVARGYIPNTLQEYKRVAGLINDAKTAGMIDWDAIEDRTRSFVRRNRWASGSAVIRACADQYHMDMWVGQANRVFVIVEKEALVGVLEPVCRKYDVPLLAARGYPSGSVIREFVERDVLPAIRGDQGVTILHLGDHDPSGIDMTRDLRERIELFVGEEEAGMVELKRIALTMHQVEDYRPPENPAKATDSRFADYRKKYGTSSWELDALTPQVLDALVSNHIDLEIELGSWEEREREIEAVKERLQDAAHRFSDEDES